MQVLLIGNMGLYDYRPYVKKISNDRQIMYDCEKEYRLDPGKYRLDPGKYRLDQGKYRLDSG